MMTLLRETPSTGRSTTSSKLSDTRILREVGFEDCKMKNKYLI